MFGLFKKKNTDVANQAQASTQQKDFTTAPGTEIRYSPTLINELQSDHQQLLGVYMAIKASFEAGDYPTVSEKLNEFRTGLQGHLLTENVRLYIYLDRMLGQDEMNSELIRNFRREMDGIGKTVLNFLKKYDAIGVDKDLAPSFGKDFAAIGAVLTERIKKEESVLYPLYMAAY